MVLSYKAKYQKLLLEHEALVKDSKSLVNHLIRIRKKCSENNLWLMASCNPHVALEDDLQQGPMVTKLYELSDKLKERL